jgi:hypothetical protein
MIFQMMVYVNPVIILVLPVKIIPINAQVAHFKAIGRINPFIPKNVLA